MLSKIITKIVLLLLRSKRLEKKYKTEVITALLDNIYALPIRDAISFDLDGTLKIGEKRIEVEDAQIIKKGISALKDNRVRKLIQEQLLYEANKIGLHQGLTPEQIQFSKAVIWVIQQEERFLNMLDER